MLKPKVPVKRMVFHEITKPAISRALEETRDIDVRLVDAQETRRILDRLYGYEISPVLWKKIMPRLSAGRVQSVATRLIVQRERERMAFRAAAWWDLLATFDPESFQARLVGLDGKRVATGRDFGSDGALRGDATQLDEDAARGLASRLEGASFRVTKVEEKPYSRKPAAPFMTSTLQQEASRKLKFTAQTTMSLAQRLYENGYITYMRTDSTTLSESALTAARNQATQLFGAGVRPRRAAPVHPEGQERAGGARGDPSRRRLLPHAAAGAERAVARRVPRLRAHLDAHGRVADEGRAGTHRLAADRRRVVRRGDGRVRRERHGDHVPRFPRGVRGGARRRPRGGRRRRGAPPPERLRGGRGRS